jgi:tetratricopeptide (TPR) repeat protein
VLGVALLAQLAIAAHGPDTATACLPVRLTAALRTPGRVTPVVEPPRGAGFQLLRSRVTSHVQRDGSGAVSTLTEAWADVAISPVGRVQLPPFVATVDGKRASSNAVVIDVREPISPPPVVLVDARLDDAHGAGARDSLFVGQQVDYRVDVLLNETARTRLRRNPTFFPPEMSSVLAYDVDIPRGMPKQGRRCFETLSYRRALFPLFPGNVAIPPAVLTYSLPLTSSFFSREESFELRSDSVRFVAIEPPPRDRPPEYAGAVGTLRITARTEAGRTRVGDPVVLTVRLSAAGNVKLLPRPSLELPWASITPGDERVEIDSTTTRISGTKEFEWLITPREAGTQVVPAIRYPYFDPVIRRYAVIATSPIPIAVGDASLVSSDTGATPRLPIRVALRAERPAPFTARPLFWALFALAPIPAALRRVVRRRRFDTRGLSAVRRLRAMAEDGAAVPSRELRQLYLDALRERVPNAGRVRESLARTLRRVGVSDGVALEAEAMLDRLDAAAFSATGSLDDRALVESAEIVAMVDREAMRPSRAAARAGGVVGAIVLVLVLSAAANAADEAQRLFDDGVRAYQRGQFAVAERRFLRVTTTMPRAADAWANLGTAAWEGADTAQAARAWHHALRLDPLDAEARDRLRTLQSLGPRSVAYVAPLSTDALASLVLAAWLGAWVLLALPSGRRPRAARPIAGGAIAVALTGLAALFEIQSRIEARDLAVLVHGRTLLETPASESRSLAAAATGEVGRLGAREGGWVHLTIDAGRAGWVPARALMPIEPVQPARLTGLAPVR